MDSIAACPRERAKPRARAASRESPRPFRREAPAAPANQRTRAWPSMLHFGPARTVLKVYCPPAGQVGIPAGR